MEKDIIKCIEVLEKGGVILYPTDIIWGLGCDATNQKAVERIFQIKKRPEGKPFIILLDDERKLFNYVKEIPEIACELIEVAVRPLTIVYPQGMNVAKNLLAEDGSIAIRIVKDEFCRKLIKKFNKPIVFTSANVSDSPAPTIFSEIEKYIINSVDYVVEWRQNDNKKSELLEIIKLGVNGEVVIIRGFK